MTRVLRAGGRAVEYQLICARNRTTFLLQALPQGKIRLYAPAGCSLRRADALVRDNLEKIEAAHRQMDAANESLPGFVLFRGERRALLVKHASKAGVCADSAGISVSSPDGSAAAINALVKKWLVKQALADIRGYLDRWSLSIGKPYGRVAIREQRTRWGSCSGKGNLNFNWKLILAPPGAMEYVVIHELCHLLYLNHSERFWAEVARRMPEYKYWKKWLKEHGRELTFP